MSSIDGAVTVDRRSPAPHPGLRLRRDYLDALGLDAVAFSVRTGIDPVRLTAMLDGAMSIDVDAAVRIARVLQLRADRIMQLQLHYDFAAARHAPGLERVAVLPAPPSQAFPPPFIGGVLGRAGNDADSAASFYFQETFERPSERDTYAGLHALWRGDRLRIYHAGGEVLWIGPVLHDLDGRILLPYASTAQWQGWFVGGYRADLAIGEEHAAFFERMRDA